MRKLEKTQKIGRKLGEILIRHTRNMLLFFRIVCTYLVTFRPYLLQIWSSSKHKYRVFSFWRSWRHCSINIIIDKMRRITNTILIFYVKLLKAFLNGNVLLKTPAKCKTSIYLCPDVDLHSNEVNIRALQNMPYTHILLGIFMDLWILRHNVGYYN